MAEPAVAVASPPAAAAPAAPAPAPAAPAAAAPTPTPTPVPDAPAQGESLTDYFHKALEEVRTAPEEGAKPAEGDKPAAGEPAKEPAAAAPAPGEGEKPAADPAAPAAAEPKPAVELDLGEGIAPSKLSEIIKAAPQAVQDWFNDPANADTKNAMYAMAKRSEKAREILDIVPDVKTAQRLNTTFEKFHDFDTTFSSVANTETARGAWSKLWQDFATQGPDGQLKAHPAFLHLERAITQANMDAVLDVAAKSGKVHPLLGGIVGKTLDVFEAQAQKDPAANGELLGAIEVLREVINKTAPSQRPVELTPEQKQLQAELDARKQAADSHDAQQREANVKAAGERVNTTVSESAVDQILPILEKANLSELEHQNAVSEVGKRLESWLQKQPVYRTEKARLEAELKANPSKEAEQALTEYVISWQQLKLGQITTEVMRDVTAGRVRRNGDKETKLAAQVDASKGEPAGAGIAAAAPKQMSEAEWEAEDKKAWEASNKKVDFLTFTFDRAMKRATQQG